MSIKEKINRAVQVAIKKTYGIDIDPKVSLCKDSKYGDYSTAVCLKLDIED